jgi:electron transport complex protein RnfG
MTTDGQTPQLEQSPSPLKIIKVLGGVAMISGLLVVLTYQLTLPTITENRRIAREKAVLSVIPGATSFVEFVLSEREGLIRVTADGKTKVPKGTVDPVYAGYDAANKFVGLALEAGAQGYQDIVRTLYGYSPACECIVGITVLESKETPGLGDKVETDPHFLANFNALEAKLNEAKTALANPIETVKHGTKKHPWQIDAITGSTVTSNAIGKGLNNSAQRLLPLLRYHFDEFEEKH